MNKKIIVAITGIVVLIIIGIASYFMIDNNGSTGSSNQENHQNDKKSDKKSDNPKIDNNENSKVVTLEEAQQEDKKETKIKSSDSVVSIEGYTREEIEGAGEFVLDYIHETHANTYFLGGEWDKSGNDIKILKDVLGRYYSNEVLSELDKYEGDNQNQDFTEKVSGMIPYFGENKNYSPSIACAVTNNKSESIKKLKETGGEIVDSIINCPIDMDISEITYESVKNDNGDYELNMFFTSKTTYPLFSKELQSDAKVKATYQYMLSLTKLSDDESDDLKWEINGYNVDVKYSKIEAL